MNNEFAISPWSMIDRLLYNLDHNVDANLPEWQRANIGRHAHTNYSPRLIALGVSRTESECHTNIV